ncbi:MAG: hypothetical protein HYW45_04095 [Candidatus Daviesbacteria bacterium]|nr:MAG: hypothetical protein HYW45_04095 [Candidatus Daviesbacteria bacterium]
MWIFLGVVTALVLLTIFQIQFNILWGKKILSEGLVGTYQEADLPLEVTKLLSQGLTKTDQTGRTVGDLAAGWEVNNDATTFKFKLKDNLRWADNLNLKSGDLDINIPNVEVSFPDEKTVEFKLKEPYSPFPSLLVSPIFKKGTRLGTGPYRLTAVEKSRIFLTKVTLSPLDAKLPELIIRFYPNEKTALTGFSLGEVQSLFGVSSNQNLSGPFISTKQATDYSKIVTILYNTKDPFLGNRSLRQALSFSAPEISGETVAKSPIPPFSWAYGTDLKDYLNDADQAKEALNRAKNSGISSLDKQIILTVTPQLEIVGERVVSAWKSLGLNVVMRAESGIAQNFQALLVVQNIPTDPDQYFLWHSTQDKTNPTKYSQARADKDLEDGRKLSNAGERKNAYIDFQKVLLEDSPATFLYFPKYSVVYLKKAETNLNQVLPLQLPQFAKSN